MQFRKELDISQYNGSGSGNPMKFLAKALKLFPDLEDEIAYMMAEEIIAVSKQYIKGTRPADFEPLWKEYMGPGGWTPEWNAKSRVENRSIAQPLSDTGHLADSFFIDILGGGYVDVGNNAEYAHFHEHGGPNPLKGHKPIPARPYLAPAFIEVETNVGIKSKISKRINMLVTRRLNGLL